MVRATFRMYVVIGAGGEGEFFHRLLEEVAERNIERAMATDLGMSHASIYRGGGAREPRGLAIASGLNPGAYQGTGFTEVVGSQFGDGKSGSLDVEVDPVEQRPADAGAVALDLGRGAAAAVPGVAQMAARTWLRSLSATFL